MGNLLFTSASRTPLLILLPLSILLYACSGSAPQLPKLKRDSTILAFGNSLTYGTGTQRERSYPAVLEQLTGLQVINAGVPGEISADGLRRLPRVLSENPADLLILCHGGNDLLRKLDRGQSEENLREMIGIAQEQGTAVVLLGVPVPGLFLNTAEFYENVSEEMKVPFEGSILPAVLRDNQLKSDPIHPNGKGYRRIAEALYKLLRDTGALD